MFSEKSRQYKPNEKSFPDVEYGYGGEIIHFPESSTTKSQAAFIHQVLNYVSIQLIITAGVSGYMYSNREDVINYFNQNPGAVWFPIIVTFISLMLMFLESCRTPMFWIFTVACSFMVGTSALSYSPKVIMMATITTMFIVWVVNAYSYWCVKNNKDLSFLGPMLFTALCILIIVGIFNIFVQSSLIESLLTIFGVVVFTGLLLFDLDRLYHKGDDYINDPMLAAVTIYLDIINLFLYLLKLYDQYCGDKR